MRCKTCHYSLANLTGPPHRCPECGTAFDPNDPSTFDSKEPRNWPGLLIIALIGLGALLYGAYRSLVPLTPTHEIPLFWQFASALFDGFLGAVGIVFLLLVGYGMGRWQYLR